MHNQNSLFLILLLFLILINPVKAKSPADELVYEDRIYNPDIKTVHLYAYKGNLASRMDPPAINFRNPLPLILEFDELYEDARYFQARIIHCDWNWTPSDLRPIEYLDEYNEFEISDYEYSVNTRVPYTHYTFRVPEVKQPGNYLLVVYDRDQHDNLVLSKRFIVFDQLVNISPVIEPSSSVEQRRTHQQINFIIDYNAIEVYNPQTDIKVVIRKNGSWITTIYNLKPTSAKEFQKILEYRHFNLENNFFGGNEYRFFDLTSVEAPGRNVDRTEINQDRLDAFLFQDRNRSHEFYSNWQDYNGGYIISNTDGIDPRTEAEYVNVHFFLRSEKQLNSDVYVYGLFSQYNLTPEFKMKYEDELGGYRKDLLLKQGWYDYIYYTPGNPYVVEGSHYETGNEYEIMVYYKPLDRITEYLIGYANFSTGQ